MASPDTTHLGIVWRPPPRPDSALRELNRIHDVGATAVRVTGLPSDTIAARADALGLQLYVDLPISYIPAARLREALQQATPTIERLLSLAQTHPSITHIGLARSTNTTVPGVCKILQRWTTRLHNRDSSLRTYYVTPFPARADRCASAVDLPLLDLRGVERPAARWEAWRAGSPPVGLGALGTWVGPTEQAGLRIPHSPERQARHLERALSRLLDSTRTAPPVVFVSRWQDRPSPPLPSRRYGLHDANGTPRPAAAVVRGFYTGTQRVFAFQKGPEPVQKMPVLPLLGWGLVALLGGLYARSPFVRQTLTRFFTAHGFYRDALREGRGLSAKTNSVLLGIVVVALGITATRVARLASTQPSTEHVLAAVPAGLRPFFAGGIEHPGVLGIAVADIALLLLLVWMTALVVVAQRWTRFLGTQGLMVVVWPCWPALLTLPIALAAGPQAPLSLSFLVVFLLGGGSLALVYLTVRVLLDYQAVTNLPWPVVVGAGTLSPLALISIFFLLLDVGYRVPFFFLWRLATQT